MSGVSPIQFGGLASGMDTNAIVDGLVSLERMRLDPIVQRKAAINNEISALGALRSRLSTLSTLAGGFKSAEAFNIFNISSSDSKRVGVRAVGNSDIGQGSVDIEVRSLARNEKMRSNAFASSTQALGLAGRISINSTEIEISATDSLRDISNKINTTPNTGVAAVMLRISDNEHRMVLTSRSGGTDGVAYADISSDVLQQLGILSDATTKNAANMIENGQNSVIAIGNMEIVRNSNVINDAIEGLELTLLQAEAGRNIRVDFSRNNDGIIGRIREFVNGINNVLTHIADNSRFDSESGRRGGLFNSTTARRVVNDLRNIINTDFSQVLPSGFSSLSQLGIRSNRDTGLLEINDDTLREKIEQDLGSVAKLFAVSGYSDTEGITFGRTTRDTRTGTYAIDTTGVPPRIGGDVAELNGTRLTSIEGNSRGLSVTVQSGVTTGNVTFIRGFSAMIEDTIRHNMLDVQHGYINTSQQSLNNLSRDKDRRMDIAEGRIESLRLRLVRQFSQVEMFISRMNFQGQSLSTLNNNMLQQR